MQAGPGNRQLPSPKDFELGLPKAVEDASDVGGTWASSLVISLPGSLPYCQKDGRWGLKVTLPHNPEARAANPLLELSGKAHFNWILRTNRLKATDLAMSVVQLLLEHIHI